MSSPSKDISFIIDGILFEYDEEKNRLNIQKHGLSFETAARVFFDYDRLELYDEIHSTEEDRFNTIGDLNAGGMVIGSAPGGRCRNRNCRIYRTTETYGKWKRNRHYPSYLSAWPTVLKGGYIMANAIDQIKVVSRQFSDTELAELDKARKMPITYDEDCPETAPEMAMRFRRVNPVRNAMS